MQDDGGRSSGDAGVSRTGPRLTLLATSASYVLVILDTSIVNVALERIAQDFAIGVAGLQWVVSAYVAVFASLVLSGGALADTVGARRTYLSGLLLFTTASLVCGCAPSLALLIGGRVLQGVGAALLVPSALSLLAQAYPDETARARAIAAWAGFGGVAQILGPLGGGLLLEVFDWRSIFLVNLPICLVGICLMRKIHARASDQGNRRLDLPGQLGAAATALLMTAALIEGRELGWSHPRAQAELTLAVMSAMALAAWLHKCASPMLPLSLFAQPVVSWMVFVIFCGSAVFFGMLFVLNLYFLQGAGYTPLQTGMAVLPLALLATFGNILAARLACGFTPLSLMAAGAAIRLAGFAAIALGSARFTYSLLAIGLTLIGFGAGLSNPMSISVLLGAVDRSYGGVMSGIATATGQLGAAMGVALFGGFIARPRDVATGTQLAAIVSIAATVLIGTIVCHLWRRRRRCTVRRILDGRQ